MSWTITEDHLDGPTSGTIGLSGYGLIVGPETPGAKRFHLYDDDDIKYYSGWLVEDDECPHGYDAWESAHSWGSYDSGTTTIKNGNYKEVI